MVKQKCISYGRNFEMEKATVLSITYEPSDSIEMQGKRRDVKKYLNVGYYIKEERNGYWILVKASQLNVTLKNCFCTRTFNMKADVCDHYGKLRISKSLINRFNQDIEDGEISIYMDLEGNYSLE